MPPLLIVKVGQTFADLAARRGDYEDWFRAGMGVADRDCQVARPHEGEPLPRPREFRGVVITGSSSMVSHREPWSERTAAWIHQVLDDDVPLLGVCYGHQLLAHALGGAVDDNPQGREIGTHDVTLTDAASIDSLLRGLPQTLHVPVTHVQAVLGLPPRATRLAHSARDPHHAFGVGSRAWGLQFHPEFDAAIVRHYIDQRRNPIEAEGQDPQALSAAARDTEHGRLILRRFAALCEGG